MKPKVSRLPPRREVPPTAGLPPRWRDLLSWHGTLAEPAAAFLGVEALQVTCSGTAALVVALTALHRMSGRRTVIVPGYTCPLVALAVAHCGLRLRLCDLGPDSIDFDHAALARLCDADTLALVPTHLGGRVVDVAASVACARAAGAFVIEDAAQALGAREGAASVGLRGDAGVFSLAVGKGLTTFEGGLLIARDARLRAAFAEVARELLPWRPGWELWRTLQLLGYHALYRPATLALAYGMPLRRALRRGSDPGARAWARAPSRACRGSLRSAMSARSCAGSAWPRSPASRSSTSVRACRACGRSSCCACAIARAATRCSRSCGARAWAWVACSSTPCPTTRAWRR